MIRDYISQYILIPTGKTYSRRNYFKAKNYQNVLENSQYKSLDELQSQQNSLLRNMILYAYENVPYYQELFKKNGIVPSDIQGKEDLRVIPFLTKDVLSRNPDKLISKIVKPGALKPGSTGGTTGTPITFYRDQDSEWKIDGSNWRFWKYCGYQLGMGLARLWGNEKDLLESVNLYGKLQCVMNNETILNFFDVSEVSLHGYVEMIKKKKPLYWKGYSSAVYAFVRYLKRNGASIPFPKAVIITADKIDDQQRGELDDFFAGSVFSEYGCREFSIIGFECPLHDGIHVSMENMVVEVVDTSNNDGYSEVVITSLTNWAMPFIRYKLGDGASELINNKCQCGISLPRIKSVAGRVTDFVVTKTGKLIHGEFFAHLLYETKGFEHFQVIQKEIGKAIMYLERNEFFSEGEVGSIQARFSEMTHKDMDLEISVVSQIEKHRSGKRRPVISEIIKDYL